MRLGAGLLTVCLCAAALSADVVHLKGGKKLRGTVVEEGSEVVVNPYNSRVPGMTFGVTRANKDRVKRIERTFDKHREFHRKMAAVKTAEEALALAKWCEEQKLKVERSVAYERVLELEPDNVAARKALGSKAPPANRAEQYLAAHKYLNAAPDEAAELLGEIIKDKKSPFSELYLRRARRSMHQPRGYHEDRPITIRADKLGSNARYTLYVPQSYDPLQPTPLLVGLHGGGAGGADRKLVVGSGPQAMPFYRGQCEKRGWIGVCPTAMEAGWRGSNHAMIDAMLDELRVLYNIDDNRIYLTGHSMGGGGTWVQGTRIPEVWAAISPTASYGPGGFDKLTKTRTGFYVYHSDNDPRTRIGGVRPAMVGLPGKGHDFVYTELPGRGHTLPGEIIEAVFEFFNVRRRGVGSRFKTSVRPDPSFAHKLSRDEKKYLPLPGASGSGAKKDALKPLLLALQKGGGVAERAVPGLIKHTDPKTDSRVAKLMIKSKSSPDTRRYAAQVLGARKAKSQIKAIGRALLIETEYNAVSAMLDALEEIGDASAGPEAVKFLKKRRIYFGSRLIGNRMHYSDWATLLPTMAKACALLGRHRPNKAATAITGDVLDAVLIADIDVRYDREMQSPLPAIRALTEAACKALVLIGDASVRPTLQRAIKKSPWRTDAKVAGHLRETLRALPKPDK